MNKGMAFIKFFDDLIEKTGTSLPDEVKEYYEIIKSSQGPNSSKPAFTEIGLKILGFMQSCGAKSVKAKDIAEGILLPPRKVSGAMRKLTDDGYVEKFGADPVIYIITEQGKNVDLKNYNKETKKSDNRQFD